MESKPCDLLLFDLDGVVTTERIYWDCARLTIWDLFQVHLPLVGPYVPAVHDRSARDSIIPEDLIYAIKNRAINSNWDLTFLVACGLLQGLPEGAGWAADTLEALLAGLRGQRRDARSWRPPTAALLEDTADLAGADLLTFAGRTTARHLGAAEALFAPDGPLWQMLYDRFQGWYVGTLTGAWGAQRLPEYPVIPTGELQQVFARLKAAGYELGIVTGRPLEEAVYALEMFGLLAHFAPHHTVTFDDVSAAQQQLGESGLGKPHPFTVRKALCPDIPIALVAQADCHTDRRALMVGDSTSDAIAARRAGIPCVGVTSGVAGAAAKMEREQALLEAGCVAVLDDIRSLQGWLEQG